MMSSFFFYYVAIFAHVKCIFTLVQIVYAFFITSYSDYMECFKLLKKNISHTTVLTMLSFIQSFTIYSKLEY